MSTKRSRNQDATEGSNKRPRPEVLTFKNRDGEVQATHSWDMTDNVVALRTAKRDNPQVHESIFFANRGILCRDSLVFDDILSLPTPENPKPEDLYEGRLVITVQDHPQELQDFLEAIHDWRFLDSPKAKEIPTVVALLRLGTKYQLSFLRRKMLQHLTEVLPQSWEEIADDERIDPFTWDECLHILGALEEIDYPLLLPIVTYIIATTWAREQILAAEIMDFSPADDEYLWCPSESCRARVLELQRVAGHLYHSNLVSALAIRHESCVTSRSCNNVLRIWPHRFSYLDYEGPGPFTLQHTLGFLQPTAYLFDYPSPAGDSGLCTLCASLAEDELTPLLKETWDALPEIISLGTWEELKGRSHMEIEDSDTESGDDEVSEAEEEEEEDEAA